MRDERIDNIKQKISTRPLSLAALAEIEKEIKKVLEVTELYPMHPHFPEILDLLVENLDLKFSVDFYRELIDVMDVAVRVIQSRAICMSLLGEFLKICQYPPLYNKYFTLVFEFLEEGKNFPSLSALLEHAMNYLLALSRIGNKNFEVYKFLAQIFDALGERERFKEEALEYLKEKALIQVLLVEGELNQAVQLYFELDGKNHSVALDIARFARETGDITLSANMVVEAFNSSLFLNSRELEAFSDVLDYEALEELAYAELSLHNSRFGRKFLEIVVERAPDLIDKFLEDTTQYPRDFLVSLFSKLIHNNPDAVQRYCLDWISNFVTRSHVYYSAVVEMLKLIKQTIINRTDTPIHEWTEYFQQFKARYQSRTKLMEMVAEIEDE